MSLDELAGEPARAQGPHRLRRPGEGYAWDRPPFSARAPSPGARTWPRRTGIVQDYQLTYLSYLRVLPHQLSLEYLH